MKKLFFLSLLFISLVGFSQAPLNWQTDFETAKSLAKSQNKPILMYFTGSDWCTPCKHLKEDYFGSEEFKSKARQVILLLVDVPFRQDIISEAQLLKNKRLRKKFNPKNSFPTLVGFSPSGNEINRISAYSYLRDTSRHFKFLEELIR